MNSVVFFSDNARGCFCGNGLAAHWAGWPKRTPSDRFAELKKFIEAFSAT